MPGLGVPTKNIFDFGQSPPPIGPTNNMFGSPSTYSAAVNTQGSDYDKIMADYDNLLKSNQTTNKPYTPIAPSLTSYSASPDVTSSIANLSGLAATGGYSDSDVNDIRARDISPIRSIYASAQQGLDRQKSLQGGYSPNYTAATAKMAREQSDIIGKKVTDVNANIAQARATNKLSIAPSFASAAQNENSARMAVEKSNADTINQINQLNAQLGLTTAAQNNANILAPIEGKRALYGTSPALVSTFGNQVAQAGQLAQGQQQINNSRQNNVFDFARSVLG